MANRYQKYKILNKIFLSLFATTTVIATCSVNNTNFNNTKKIEEEQKQTFKKMLDEKVNEIISKANIKIERYAGDKKYLNGKMIDVTNNVQINEFKNINKALNNVSTIKYSTEEELVNSVINSNTWEQVFIDENKKIVSNKEIEKMWRDPSGLTYETYYKLNNKYYNPFDSNDSEKLFNDIHNGQIIDANVKTIYKNKITGEITTDIDRLKLMLKKVFNEKFTKIFDEYYQVSLSTIKENNITNYDINNSNNIGSNNLINFTTHSQQNSWKYRKNNTEIYKSIGKKWIKNNILSEHSYFNNITKQDAMEIAKYNDKHFKLKSLNNVGSSLLSLNKNGNFLDFSSFNISNTENKKSLYFWIRSYYSDIGYEHYRFLLKFKTSIAEAVSHYKKNINNILPYNSFGETNYDDINFYGFASQEKLINASRMFIEELIKKYFPQTNETIAFDSESVYDFNSKTDLNYNYNSENIVKNFYSDLSNKLNKHIDLFITNASMRNGYIDRVVNNSFDKIGDIAIYKNNAFLFKNNASFIPISIIDFKTNLKQLNLLKSSPTNLKYVGKEIKNIIIDPTNIGSNQITYSKAYWINKQNKKEINENHFFIPGEQIYLALKNKYGKIIDTYGKYVNYKNQWNSSLENNISYNFFYKNLILGERLRNLYKYIKLNDFFLIKANREILASYIKTRSDKKLTYKQNDIKNNFFNLWCLELEKNNKLYFDSYNSLIEYVKIMAATEIVNYKE